METIEDLWQQIEAGMQRHALQLAPGADEEALNYLEKLLDITLPEDVRISYRRHNGGYEVQLVSTMEILPVEGIISNWQVLKELLEDDDWASHPPYYFTNEIVLRSGWQPGPLQPVWWHPRWIPFGTDSAGNLCCLDLAPASGGTVGQILDWDHECGPSRVLFPNFQQFLSAIVQDLENSSE